jgi:hypothetical protein
VNTVLIKAGRHMRARKQSVCCISATLIALGCAEPNEDTVAPTTCPPLDRMSFDAESGWQSESYCPAPTALGCYPYHAESDATFRAPISLRTSSTSAADIGACEELLTSLHCRRYVTDEVDLRLTVEAADRLTMRVVGSWYSLAVNTVWLFNPCQPSCLAAVSTDAIEASQQKICDIPSSGKPLCLFDNDSHSITFLRAAPDGLIIRLAGEDHSLPAADQE